MKHRTLVLFLLALSLGLPAAAQRVETRNTHVRMWAIDTYVLDSRGRPVPAHQAGMLAYVVIFHKDICAVEYVAQTASAHTPLLNDLAVATDVRLKVFDRNHTKAADFLAALKAAGFPPIDLD